MNLHLLSRMLAQPWAMRDLELAVMTQLIIGPAAHLSGNVSAGSNENGSTGKLSRNVAAETTAAKMMGQQTGQYPIINVIPVWGCLGRGWEDYETDYFGCVDVDDLREEIEESPAGAPVVLWFRSPGGIVTGIPETAAYLREASKTRNIIAFTDDLCCSAAYWLAAQCSSIHATPTAALGSIGVYIAFYDWTGYLEQSGIKLELFKAGRMKAMGLTGNPLSDEERAYLQNSVSTTYAQFTAEVSSQRMIDSEAMQGQTFTGKDSLRRNLCDQQWPSAADFFTALAANRI